MQKITKVLKNFFALKEINPVIRILIFSDLMIIGGYGLISPIFAVYITDNIPNGNIEVVGIATAIFTISQSIFQIPLAMLLDKIKGEKDDFYALFIGSCIFSIVPLLYIIVNSPMQLYLVQFFYGLVTAFTLPSWLAIFTRHVDKQHEGVEWGVYRTFVDIGGAVTAFVGGYIAFKYSFIPLFYLVSITSFAGCLFLLIIYKHLKIPVQVKVKK